MIGSKSRDKESRKVQSGWWIDVSLSKITIIIVCICNFWELHSVLRTMCYYLSQMLFLVTKVTKYLELVCPWEPVQFLKLVLRQGVLFKLSAKEHISVAEFCGPGRTVSLQVCSCCPWLRVPWVSQSLPAQKAPHATQMLKVLWRSPWSPEYYNGSGKRLLPYPNKEASMEGLLPEVSLFSCGLIA